MNKLLIVVDMQNDFIDGALGTLEAVGIVPAVQSKMEQHEGPMICTRDTHGENYLQTQEGRNLPVPHCIKGTKGWELNPKIAHAAEEKKAQILDKYSFGSLELADIVKQMVQEEKIDRIELVGLCTDICVITNAMILKTALPETVITVDGSCCAGVTPQSHENALAAMKMCQITVE